MTLVTLGGRQDFVDREPLKIMALRMQDLTQITLCKCSCELSMLVSLDRLSSGVLDL
jgi:hypothetical protein